MIEAGRALAFLRGPRLCGWPEDVVDVAADVLRHRVVLSYEALSDGVSADDLVRQVLKAIPAPQKVLEAHAPRRVSSAEHLLKRLEWTVIRKLDGLPAGRLQNAVPRLRARTLRICAKYQSHDDVRHNRLETSRARTQVPHVRVYNEDREVSAWFLLDLSPSVDFGSGEGHQAGGAGGIHRCRGAGS